MYSLNMRGDRFDSCISLVGPILSLFFIIVRSMSCITSSLSLFSAILFFSFEEFVCYV